MQKRIFFILLLFGITITVKAQSNEFIFKNYDIQDGLCDNNINSMIEDDKGFIWIGTKEGLSRFDGAEFRNFYFTPNGGNTGSYSSLQNFGIDRILLLYNFRLALLNTASQSLKIIPQFKNQQILEITQLNRNLFALNASDHFILIDNQFNIVGKIKPKGKIYSFLFIRKLSQNTFLVGNCFDYYQYDLAAKKLTPFPLDMHKFQKGNFAQFELKFIDEKEQKIYIGDYFSGLYVFDFEGQLIKNYQIGANELSSTNFIAFAKDKENALWIGTHKGINRIKNNKVQIIEHRDENDLSVKSDAISAFLLDKNNNMWIGTSQGISVYKNKLNLKIGSIPIVSKNEVVINSIAFCDNMMYVGSYLDNVYKVTPEQKKADVLKTETRIWGISNYDDILYFTGANPTNEVESYDPAKGKFSKTNFLKEKYPLTDIITLVYKHSNGDFWYSGNAGGGFVRKEAATGKLISYYKDKNGKPLFSSSYYSNVCEDADKNLWFAVNRSNLLLQWNYKTQQFKEINFNDFNETKNHYFGGITGLKIDKQNAIWISFEGGGIIKFNPQTNTIKSYDMARGLNTNYISDIEFDNKERLWLISSKGVGCLDTKTDTFYPMDIWDGFTDIPEHYNVLEMDESRNTMWIGALQKLYYFNPDQVLQGKKVLTKVYLEYLKVNQKQTDISKHKTEFKPNENSLEFRLVAVDIETGKNLEYSYQLKGLSDQWIDLESNRTVSFQKLKAGNYSFNARVRTKGSRDWVYLAHPYSFSIAHYWYETWWFMLLAFVLVAFLIWAVIYYNFKKKLEKQKAVEEERNRIAADMHDDLGSGLTKITYLSQMALQKENNAALLSNIKSTSTELVESMSEIIWAMKEENNSCEELLSYIKLYAQEYCQNNHLNISFDYPEEEMNFEIIGEVRRNIFLAIKECLHNIVKHAEAKNVTIIIKKKATIDITIQDDGKGMTVNSEKHIGGNGLNNIHKRMEKINAQFTIVNDNGTTILFKIPYKNQPKG
ncbi:histidine kinase [Flavobacterium sp. AS60]|uniref:ligand-binding sensor domain-containing protein n=1 Tax=Flavobacterium anseongense TaxID=2910677 RepID=UPI001F2E00EC|nr:two-component regulator propeller domain-containing protein [Flavobacterium sp. AS60]MCF6129496.1 histidine kinase [Flavobacterium sp. AS60]